jgi:hypothetical protein
MLKKFPRFARLVQTLNGDPAASPLSGVHRIGAPYSLHRKPKGCASGTSSAAALLIDFFGQTSAAFWGCAAGPGHWTLARWKRISTCLYSRTQIDRFVWLSGLAGVL